MADNGNVIIKILADSSDFERDLARLKKGLVALGAAASAFAVSAIRSGSSIEFELTKASLAAGDTVKNIKAGVGVFADFKKAAIDATKGTMFTSNEAAQALTALAKAGLDASTAIDTLPSVLNMAQAGEIDLGSAAESLVNIMSALGLGVDGAKVAIDQMAKAADATTSDMADLIQGMLRIGAMGKNAAGGTKELSGALAILRQNGIEAAQAGTALRNIYTRLLGGNKQATEGFKALGVSTRDASGNLRPLVDIMADLNNALAGLSPDQRELQITQIFDVFNATAARNLMENVDALRALDSELNNAAGSAARVSETLGETFRGKLQQLNKAYKDLGDTLFGEANPAMKDAVGALADFLNEFSQSQQVKNFGSAISDLVASLSEMGQKVLPTVVSLTSTLASGVSFAARNITALTSAFIAYKVATLAATAASKSFWASLKAGLISTGWGALFVALGFAIQAIIDNFDVLSIRAQQAWIWIKKLFAGSETSSALDRKLADLDKRLLKIRENSTIKIDISPKVQGGQNPYKDLKELRAQIKGFEDDVKGAKSAYAELYDALMRGENVDLAELKARQQSLQWLENSLATAKAWANEMEQINQSASIGGMGAGGKFPTQQTTDIEGENTIGSDTWQQAWEKRRAAWAEDNTLAQRNMRLAAELEDAWSSAMIAIGQSVEDGFAAVVSGEGGINVALQGIVDNMAETMSQMGDVLIKEGTMLQLAELALDPPTMIAAGIAAKALAGVMRGMIARNKAGKYAKGGIVGGTSWQGDNVPAMVNSGELILNRAQQDNLAKQLTSAPTVNVQVINNAGADVSVQQGSSASEILVMIDNRIDNYVASARGGRAIKAAAANKGY